MMKLVAAYLILMERGYFVTVRCKAVTFNSKSSEQISLFSLLSSITRSILSINNFKREKSVFCERMS